MNAGDLYVMSWGELMQCVFICFQSIIMSKKLTVTSGNKPFMGMR